LIGEQIQVAHVPKTIDNDIPLAGDMPTFGYETARQWARKLSARSWKMRRRQRWYYVVSMGRKAGHLA